MMNEQIKKIALECYNPYSNFDINKFARLIIQECNELNAKELSAAASIRMFDIYYEHFGFANSESEK